ncbi:glycosyltransferase family 87 protein [Pseudonocardia acaciae]|uniref:glycosyltransferase family 87 protein n=1 Tax=Pseudonocardia acaciae TaxID=551276 RepID=UPI0012EE21C3|nr:glycosyltransferase family 87 protein [Pseudonocardia acaciae]
MIVFARRLLPGLRDGFAVVLAVAGLVLACWLYVRFGSGNFARLASTDMYWHVDFESFWQSTVALREGADLYLTGTTAVNLNPPLLAILMLPLAWLQPLAAYHLFALLNLVLIVGSVIAVAERVRLRPGWAMVAVGALLASSPLHGTLALGQVYGLLTAAITAAWLAQRRGRTVLAGVAVGLAIALKPSLLPLLAWPALRYRWDTVGAAVTTALAATGLGVLGAGWDATVEWFGVLHAVRPDGFLDNDSLACLAVRFGLPTWPGYAVASVLMVITLYRARRRREMAVWSITAAALLLAPIAWNNYLVLLAPTVPLLLARGRLTAALPLMTLPLVGIEWSSLLGTDTLGLLGMSLYCGMLLTYWAVLTFGPADVPKPRPVTVSECRRSSVPASEGRWPEPSRSL